MLKIYRNLKGGGKYTITSTNTDEFEIQLEKDNYKYTSFFKITDVKYTAGVSSKEDAWTIPYYGNSTPDAKHVSVQRDVYNMLYVFHQNASVGVNSVLSGVVEEETPLVVPRAETKNVIKKEAL